jgi:hypothetical protein
MIIEQQCPHYVHGNQTWQWCNGKASINMMTSPFKTSIFSGISHCHVSLPEGRYDITEEVMGNILYGVWWDLLGQRKVFLCKPYWPSWPLQPRTGGMRKTLWREPVLWRTPDCVHYLHTASDGLAPMSLWWCDIPGRWATVWILDREHGPRSSSWEWIRLEQLVCDGWWTFCLAFAAELH